MFEIDGGKEREYSQNLCYLAKLFLDHKCGARLGTGPIAHPRNPRSPSEPCSMTSSPSCFTSCASWTTGATTQWVTSPRKSTRTRATTSPASSRSLATRHAHKPQSLSRTARRRL